MDKKQENKILIDSFLDYLKKVQGFSDKTVVSYNHDLMRLYDYCSRHDLSVKEFVFEDAKAFSMELYEQKLKPSTINRILSGNRSFFHNLCEEGNIETQPFSRVSRAKQGQRLPTVLAPEEIDLILNQPYDDYDTLLEVTMFNVFYSTGCRLSEILDMELKNLNIEGRRVLVTGKGSKQRYVFLTEKAVDLLLKYLKQREKVLESKKTDESCVFINKKGNKLPVSTVHSIFDKYRVKLGLTKKFTPHVFRHSFATHLLDNNSDIRIVQALLGHESIGTTQVYTHITSKRLENVYKKSHPHAEEKKEQI